MSKQFLMALFCGILCVALGLQAQESRAPAKPDSPKVKAEIEKAKKTGGPMWATAEHFFCEDSKPNKPDDPLIEPTKIFDNVYAIGRAGTTVYALTTSDGIILIDSGYADQLESVLLPGMQKLGLDPAKVKYILLGHGHVDHYGGAAYFQEKYGTHVVLSAKDWDLIDQTAANQKAKGKAAGPTPPKRDMVAEEGKPLVLGDEKIDIFFIPGHTPGSMAFIFPVKDNGKTHMAGLYGGTILLVGRISDAGLQEYLKSIAHFREAAKKAKVDVELQNHSLYDNIQEKIAKLQTRKPGDPNPFVVGTANYLKFLGVMSDCMQVQIDRRAE